MHRYSNARRTAAWVCGFVLLSATTGAVCEDAATAPEIPRSKPVNLQVLPKDISALEIGKVMKRFEADLGVTCNHCHVENPATQKFDYASDENPDKATARLMISMLQDINDKYLAQLGGDRRYAVPVTCGSCHLGQSSPPSFESR